MLFLTSVLWVRLRMLFFLFYFVVQRQSMNQVVSSHHNQAADTLNVIFRCQYSLFIYIWYIQILTIFIHFIYYIICCFGIHRSNATHPKALTSEKTNSRAKVLESRRPVQVVGLSAVWPWNLVVTGTTTQGTSGRTKLKITRKQKGYMIYIYILFLFWTSVSKWIFVIAQTTQVAIRNLGSIVH